MSLFILNNLMNYKNEGIFLETVHLNKIKCTLFIYQKEKIKFVINIALRYDGFVLIYNKNWFVYNYDFNFTKKDEEKITLMYDNFHKMEDLNKISKSLRNFEYNYYVVVPININYNKFNFKTNMSMNYIFECIKKFIQILH
jgi:hypothetical protein